MRFVRVKHNFKKNTNPIELRPFFGVGIGAASDEGKKRRENEGLAVGLEALGVEEDPLGDVFFGVDLAVFEVGVLKQLAAED